MIYQPYPFKEYGLDPEGYIYILEFSKPLFHAKYYCGFTTNLDKRLEMHKTGRGSHITKACVANGIELKVIATLPGNRTMERLLKKQKNMPRIVQQIQNATYQYPYFYTGVQES